MNPIEIKGKRQQLSIVNKQKICELAKKTKKLILKNIFDKIHKEFKLNVDCHNKININDNLLQV